MILCKILRLRVTNVFDEFFLYDDDSALSNVALAHSFSKFEFKPMCDYLLQEFQKIKPINITVASYFGKSYFKKFNPKELV